MFLNTPIDGPDPGSSTMHRRKKWLRRLLAALVACLLVAASLLFVLFHHIRPEALQERILTESSRLLPGHFEFATVTLSLLPIPRVFIHNIHWQLPGRVTLKLDYLALTPRLLPLLMGRVEIARLRAEHPVVYWNGPMPERSAVPSENGQELPTDWEQLAATVGRLPAGLATAIAGWVATTPEMKVAINQGELVVLPETGNEPLFQLIGLKARMVLSPNRLQADLSVTSPRDEMLSLESWLDPRDLTGEASLTLHQFQFHRLLPLLFPQLGPQFTDSQISGRLFCKLNGPDSWTGSFRGWLPGISLTVHDRPLQLQGGQLAASFQSERDQLLISLDALELRTPRLQTSASLFVDHSKPQVQVALQAWDIDVPAVRAAALDLMGDSPTTAKVFTIVQGGMVPWLTWHAQAASLAALDDATCHIVTGSMEHGTILVPGIDLPAHDAQGQVLITGGTLYGEALAGRTERSRGTAGTLLVGLGEGDAPFHLEIELEADLKELHEILQREVENKRFHAEMTRIAEVHGRATGRMVLGESTKSVEAQVDVRDFSLTGRYQRIPYPVAVDHGRFQFRDDWVAVEQLSGRLGSSTFAGFSAWIGWEWQPFLQVFSMSGKVSLPETYSWLISHPTLKAALPELSSVQGSFALASLDLGAPLTGPDKWQLRLAGQLERTTLQAARLPAPLSVDHGTVMATREQISLNNAHLRLSDGSLEGAATIRGYLAGKPIVDFNGQGELGADSTRWVEDGLKLPPALRLRAPLRLSGVSSSWERNDQFQFAGSLTTPNGPQATLEISCAPSEVTIKQLNIRGSGSDAFMALTWNVAAADLIFRGTLQRQALDQLLQTNTFLDGWINGDGSGHLDFRRDVPATAQGSLNLAGLTIPWGAPAPVRIEKASLRGTGKELRVDSATLVVPDNAIELTGSVGAVNSVYQLDLQLQSRDLDWNSLERLWKKEAEQPGQHAPAADIPWDLPFRGKLRLEAGAIRYGERLWQPLDATVALHQDHVTIDIARSGLCGIPISGTMKQSAAGTHLDLQWESKDQQLDPALDCIWQRKGIVEGTYRLDGWLSARSERHPLTEQSRGHTRFLARNGRIYRLTVLAKILAILNVTEVLRGKFPDLAREGFAYETMSAYGDIRDGHLKLTRAVIDGSAMKIIAQGDVDLMHQQLDLTVLVAPLKTADAIFSNIPLLGRIVTGKNGTLLSFPFSVKGDIKDPEISSLPPNTVGSGLLDLLKQTAE